MTGSGKSVYLSHLGKWKACLYHTTLSAWTRLVFLLTDLMSGMVERILIQATWKDAISEYNTNIYSISLPMA